MVEAVEARDQALVAMPGSDARVQAACIASVYERSSKNRIANVIAAAVVGGVLWESVSHAVIIAWWLAIASMLAWRYAGAISYKRGSAKQSTATWAKRFATGSLVSGMIWGIGAAVMFPPGNVAGQLLLCFVVVGMAAGGTASLSSHLPTLYAYVIPAVVPLAIRSTMIGDDVHIGMGILMLSFVIIVVQLGRRSHAVLVDSFRLRFSNESLVARLTAVGETLEKRVRDRTARLEKESRARVEAEKQLQQAQRLDAVGRLTGGVAHDFNNLLTVIVQSLESLAADAREPETQESVRVALGAALRGGELTRSLLAFSRRQELRPEVVDVGQAIETLIGTMLRRVLPKSMSVVATVAPGPCLARVDRTQLESAILNLSLNARDATSGRGSLRIVVEPRIVENPPEDLVSGEYVSISVVDDGAGMDAAVIDRVFEPFFTTKGEHGTGLGLSMVYGFARQSAGTARIESAPGEGTTVQLLLPRHLGAASMEQPRSCPAEAFGYGALVLVVEDEPAVRALTVRSVEALGYRVLEAANAAEALRLLESTKAVRVVMTDVVMPGELDGHELAEAIQRSRPDVGILIATGYDPTPRLPAPWRTLSKPYRRDQLAAALKDALKTASTSAVV